MDKCRACLATASNLMPMDVSFLENFNLLTGLSITMSDNSLYTCKSCYDAVHFCMDFRKRCIESDLSLQQISGTVEKMKQEMSSVNKDYSEVIKEEMNLELIEIYAESQSNSDDDGFSSKTELEYVNPKKKTVSKRKISDHNKKRMKKFNANKDEIKRKIEEKHSDSKVHCGLCDSKFYDRTELGKHLEYHKSLFDTQVSCSLCTERFVNLPHMLGHRLEHIPEKQKICHICCKKFIASSATCLEFHYMRVHGMAEKDAPIQCKQCASRYSSSRQLIRHVRNCHAAPRYQCALCNKGFRNTTLLKNHTKMKHTETKRVKCELCDFTSKYPNSLMLHTRRKHTENTFTCKACHRVFLDEELLARHVAHVCKHHARVVCAVCGHTVKKIWLKQHMVSHSDDYPFKCPQCPAQYKYRTGLCEHVAKHAGTLSFHCDLCTKSFCVKSALHSHRKTHHVEKPFVCEICNTGFKRRYNLKTHMNAHPWSTTGREHAEQKRT